MAVTPVAIDFIRIDINSGKVRKAVSALYKDSTRTLNITLADAGNALDLSDVLFAEILITKTDGTETDSGCVIVGDTVQYTLTSNDLGALGSNTAQIMLTYSDGTVLTTPPFEINVYSKVLDQKVQKSTNDYTALAQQVALAKAYVEGIGDAVEQSASSAASAATSAANASEFATNAAASASEAVVSASQAQESATTAALSEADATNSANESKTYYDKVEAKATEILNGESKAEEYAAASAASAAQSAESATASAASAAQSAESATASAASAAQSAESATSAKTNIATLTSNLSTYQAQDYNHRRRTRKDITSDLTNLSTAIAEQNLEKYGYSIGDYFTGASGYTYFLADMDTYYGGYDSYGVTSKHHCTLVIDTHSTTTYQSSGNPSSYAQSTLHSYLTGTVLTNVKSDLTALFGDWSSHLVTSAQLLNNAIGSWGGNTWYDGTIRAMSEVNVYGSPIWSADGYQQGCDNKPLELFQKYRFNEIYGNTLIWLKSLVSASVACVARGAGRALDFSVAGVLRASGLILFY